MNEDQNASAPADPVAPVDAPVVPVEAPVVPDAPAADVVDATVASADPVVAPEGAAVPEEPAAPAADEVKQAVGDVCETADGKRGHLTPLNDGSLTCTVDPVIGEFCVCPDGRDGVYGTLDDTGKMFCIPRVGY
jgi:hypothetical protein